MLSKLPAFPLESRVARMVGRENVRPPVTDRLQVQFSVEEAERATGITKMQVSRWRKSLADKEKYRDKLIQAAFRKAESRVARMVAREIRSPGYRKAR
jgi:hypothetical protein